MFKRLRVKSFRVCRVQGFRVSGCIRVHACYAGSSPLVVAHLSYYRQVEVPNPELLNPKNL